MSAVIIVCVCGVGRVVLYHGMCCVVWRGSGVASCEVVLLICLVCGDVSCGVVGWVVGCVEGVCH